MSQKVANNTEIQNKISSNNMTKTIQRNIMFLEGFITNSKSDIKDNVKTIVQLYKDRKISNLTTAENMIINLRTIRPSTKIKTMKQYDKLIQKYQQNEPLNVRMQATKTKNIEKKVVVKKTHAADKIRKLYKGFFNKKYATTYLIDVLLFSPVKLHEKHKPYKGVYLIGTGPIQLEVQAPKSFPPDIYKTFIKNDQKKEFKKGINIFMTSKDFKERWGHQPGYIVAFKIMSAEELGDTGKEYNPLDEDLMDASNVSCNFNYIETSLNLDSKTFMESIKKEKYTQNECWINSITDFYGDTLMNTNRKRNILTRDKLLTILNKTEETVKLGISITDVLPFFKQYKLKLRVFDVFGKMICRQDPETRNDNNKAM